MNEYVSLVSHGGRLYALTKEGVVYEITINAGGRISVDKLLTMPAIK